MRFIFPFNIIEKASRIVLYGASEAGYDFYRQIVSTGYCEIVLWVDRQYEWWRKMNLPVDPPESICGCSFDVILLTAEKWDVAESMKKDLLRMGVQSEMIFWKDDYLIKGNIAARYDNDRIISEAKEAVQDDPLRYVNEESLDIIIRVMYARDIIERNIDEKHEQMYRRLMMVQNNGVEPTENMINAYFTAYTLKSGWEAFDHSFRELIYSMAKEGFRRNDFIPIDRLGCMIGGRHRLSAAIALGIPVWVRKYEYNGISLSFNKEWLIQNGFDDEISEIMNYYSRYMNKKILR